ncbi:MAG TPA: 3-oxo-tetronate kinase [Beijerinckiaceae bacterium]|nr:3-oxo-tetronate kinase [Beijerinckiaceae bacterium]
MLLGVIADDFTGASDIANTLAKGFGGGGLRTTQFLGVPQRPAPASCDAGVVALKSRSIAADEAVAQSLAALRWLQDQGCRQFVFKYCSTFDSTSAGNIGPVGEALAEALGVAGVPACPAFPAAGRTVYQGHLFVGDRLLSETSLRTHPLNPMTDPDIRRWLALQSKRPVGLVPYATVAKGATALGAALDEAAGRGECLVIVDALTEADLLAIGAACADRPFLTGGSGIAIGLPRNFIGKGLAEAAQPAFEGVRGPEAILAGSCSGATLGQIALHREKHPALNVAVDDVLAGALRAEQLVAFVETHRGSEPLIYSSEPPERVAASQQRHGAAKVAHAIESLFAETARALVDAGVRRLVVAGGETSGAVVSALDIDALEIGPEIDPGVPVVIARGDRTLALALKSGNFGAPDFFSKALRSLGGPA